MLHRFSFWCWVKWYRTLRVRPQHQRGMGFIDANGLPCRYPFHYVWRRPSQGGASDG